MLSNRVKLVTFLLLATSVLVSARAADPSSSHAVRQSEIAWLPGPPELPKGVRMAVLAGDPSQAGHFTLRLELPAGTRIAPHVHPVTEHVTVIKGRLGTAAGEVFDEKALTWLGAGDFFTFAANQPHYGRARTLSVIEIDAVGPWGFTYVGDEASAQPTR